MVKTKEEIHMSSLQTVKQVCQRTGLNRKLLYDYRDVVKPAGYANYMVDGTSGYKLYDEAGVMKLQQISFYRKLGLERKEIISIIASPDYDSNRVLAEQYHMLQKKKREIEEMILAVENLKLIGTKNSVLDMFNRVSLSQLAQNVERWNNSSCYEELCNGITSEELEAFADEISPLLDEFFSLRSDSYNSSEAYDLIVRIFAVVKAHLGAIGYFMLFVIACCALGEGEYLPELDKMLGHSMSVDQANAVMFYLGQDAELFIDDLAEVLAKHEDTLGADFSDPRVDVLRQDMLPVWAEHFGLNKETDLRVIFRFLEIEPVEDNPTYFNYALNVMKHYYDKV